MRPPKLELSHAAQTHKDMVTVAATPVCRRPHGQIRHAQRTCHQTAWWPPAPSRPFSAEIMDAAYNATNELFTEVADKNPIFKKLYESKSAFRNEQYAWHQVCEVTLVRKRSRA